MVEQPFGVEVSRTHKEGKSRYEQPVVWVDYRLNRTEYNREGIKKMQEYVQKEIATINVLTDNQHRHLKQLSLL
jgi:hypothetical protein